MDREGWRAVVHGGAKSQRQLNDWTELTELVNEWGWVQQVVDLRNTQADD